MIKPIVFILNYTIIPLLAIAVLTSGCSKFDVSNDIVVQFALTTVPCKPSTRVD